MNDILTQSDLMKALNCKRQGDLVMTITRALIVRQPHIDNIFKNGKIWEKPIIKDPVPITQIWEEEKRMNNSNKAVQDFETGTSEEVFHSAIKAAVIYYEE